MLPSSTALWLAGEGAYPNQVRHAKLCAFFRTRTRSSSSGSWLFRYAFGLMQLAMTTSLGSRPSMMSNSVLRMVVGRSWGRVNAIDMHVWQRGQCKGGTRMDRRYMTISTWTKSRRMRSKQLRGWGQGG